MQNWYPNDKEELEELIEKYFKAKVKKKTNKEIHGLIVPHAGYEFSGPIAGKAFSLLRNKEINKAIVIGPTHYVGFYGVRAINNVESALGKVNLIKNNYPKLTYEHSVDNQIPFLQKLNPEIQILPLVVGEISEDEAENIVNELSKINAVFIFSTDLSHFLEYNKAKIVDKETIKVIENLDISNFEKIDACGKFPLRIMMQLCKLKGWKPELIEYKNSGDVIKDKSKVVGYCSFYF